MIRRTLGLCAALALALGSFVAIAAAQQQPVQWGYAFDVNGNAVATYPGNITILGTCTGCAGTSILGTPNTWTAVQTFQATTLLQGASTFSGTATFQGGATTLAATLPNMGEGATITAAAPAATTNYDVLTQSVQVYTTNAANNWTLNLRGNGSTTLNSVMATGQALTVALVTTQGASPFFANAVTIDGSAVTPKWQGGVPTAGNASGLDVYTFTVIKTASATYTVLASQVQFK